ncbi:MAG: type II secretion system protein [Kiritimatiellae bacterium]|nr:type II secretion system protein [Kiritimatiellia bacterium]
MKVQRFGRFRKVRGGALSGFTLIEMLVVMGILAILIGAGMTTFSSATKKAQQARAREVVSNVATALEAIYQRESSFPRRVISNGSRDGEMTADVAYELAKRNAMTLTYDSSTKKTVGADRCGILTPWGQDTVKRKGNKGVSDGTAVPSGGTIRDHRIHFAVDTEGLGYVNASVGGETLKIRASAVAWSCGRDGKIWKYSDGLKRDNCYSWSRQQVEK